MRFILGLTTDMPMVIIRSRREAGCGWKQTTAGNSSSEYGTEQVAESGNAAKEDDKWKFIPDGA